MKVIIPEWLENNKKEIAIGASLSFAIILVFLVAVGINQDDPAPAPSEDYIFKTQAVKTESRYNFSKGEHPNLRGLERMNGLTRNVFELLTLMLIMGLILGLMTQLTKILGSNNL